MTNVPTWISRVSAIALATASITAFAAAPGAPEYLMHKASVNLKTSSQGVGNIERDKIKTLDVVNFIMGRAEGTKKVKNEDLGLVTGCDADVDAVALVVYDRKLEAVLSSPASAIVLDIEDQILEFNNNSQLKKGDLIASLEDSGNFLDVTGQVKYGKIGNKVAKVDKVQVWDKTSVCARSFKTNSLTGVGVLGDIVMSGKINAGSAQFGSDGDIFPGVILGVAKAVDTISNGETFVTAAGDTVTYDIDVTNAGTQQVTGLSVEDALAGPVACVSTTLNAGASTSCSATMTVTQAQFDTACGPSIGQGPATIENIAVATVTETTSSFASNAFVDVDCDDDGGAGAIAIAKSSGVENADVGDTITYTIGLTNLTGGPLTGVTVADARADSLDCEGNGDGTVGALADGATASCTSTITVTQADEDLACATGGSLRNIATVTSTETESFAADDLVGLDCAGTTTN